MIDTDALTDESVRLADHILKSVPEGTETLMGLMGLAVALGSGIHAGIGERKREETLRILSGVVHTLARGEDSH